jgi:hypothetical protein
MARQVIQINITQESSGSGVAVSWSWTTDANPVMSHRSYLRQPGSYTIDLTLVRELERACLAIARDTLKHEQLF